MRNSLASRIRDRCPFPLGLTRNAAIVRHASIAAIGTRYALRVPLQ